MKVLWQVGGFVIVLPYLFALWFSDHLITWLVESAQRRASRCDRLVVAWFERRKR
jgi:hypothetical protein